MTGRSQLAVFVLFGIMVASPAVAQEHSFSLALKGNLTTASRLFPHPNSSDIFERSEYFSLEDFFGYGVEFRYKFPETNIAFGLSFDYISTTTSELVRINSTFIPREVGYRVVPLELTGYFFIPVSGQTFGVFMGGGVGGYFGRQVYKLGDTEAPTVDRGTGFGIHVLGGLSYRFTEWFSLSAEMKFRDLQFKTTNRFSSPTITYDGSVVATPSTPLDASVHTDGVVFQLGTVFDF